MSPDPTPTEPTDLDADDHPELAAANARAGLRLFALYSALYAGFMGLNAFAPDLMGRTLPGGLNLAVAYGFALIAAAVVLALAYMAACRRAGRRHRAGGPGR